MVAAAEDRAYRAIRAAIVNGAHREGAHIDAGSIAASLGISRTPVREALRRLHAEGLLTLIANRGAYVTPWTRDDLDELFGLRVVIESHAAMVAAGRLDATGIGRLEELAEAMERAVGEPLHPLPAEDVQAVMTLNAEFHRTIIGYAGTRRLTAVMSSLVDTPLITRTFALYGAADMGRSMAHHRELIAAFAARDGDWAASVMRSHLHAAHHVLLRSRAAAAPAPAPAAAPRRGPRRRGQVAAD